MLKRPAFWILLALVSILGTAAAVHYFPQAFSIVALDITMTRERALADAARDRRARPVSDPPATARRRRSRSTARRRRSSSWKAAARRRSRACCATALLRLHVARAPLPAKARPTRRPSASRPTARPYGFVEKMKEDAPGAALAAGAARAIARGTERVRGWNVDLRRSRSSNRDRNGGRAGASITRSPTNARQPALGEGRYRLRLVVSGDRLTEVTHFVRIPEAFTRRYDEHAFGERSHRHRFGRRHGAPLRRRRHRRRPVLHAAQALRAVAAGRRSGASRSARCRRWPP